MTSSTTKEYIKCEICGEIWMEKPLDREFELITRETQDEVYDRYDKERDTLVIHTPRNKPKARHVAMYIPNFRRETETEVRYPKREKTKRKKIVEDDEELDKQIDAYDHEWQRNRMDVEDEEPEEKKVPSKKPSLKSFAFWYAKTIMHNSKPDLTHVRLLEKKNTGYILNAGDVKDSKCKFKVMEGHSLFSVLNPDRNFTKMFFPEGFKLTVAMATLFFVTTIDYKEDVPLFKLEVYEQVMDTEEDQKSWVLRVENTEGLPTMEEVFDHIIEKANKKKAMNWENRYKLDSIKKYNVISGIRFGDVQTYLHELAKN